MRTGMGFQMNFNESRAAQLRVGPAGGGLSLAVPAGLTEAECQSVEGSESVRGVSPGPGHRDWHPGAAEWPGPRPG